jgi:nitroimidazol reductase NimA-like FMN-containing flavoprotein (pyridoxamine 5'-phosphate oxidase superfamily)
MAGAGLSDSMSIRLSRAEAWAVLGAAHTGIFTSLRADGVPIALPVWFVALDERIYLDAVTRTKKVARIRRDPRVAFLVESGERWAELRSVHLTGHAAVLTDPDVEARARELMRAKYAGFAGDRPRMPDETRAHYESDHLMIEMVPDERILSFDNSRIDLAHP